MSYINADIAAIVQLSNHIEQYRSEMQQIQQQLNERFAELGANGKWADDKYKTFSETQMSDLNTQVDVLYQTIDNRLLPYLHDLYRRLKEYQDTW